MHFRISWLLWQKVLPKVTPFKPFLDLPRVDLVLIQSFNPAQNAASLRSSLLLCGVLLHNHVGWCLGLLGELSRAPPWSCPLLSSLSLASLFLETSAALNPLFFSWLMFSSNHPSPLSCSLLFNLSCLLLLHFSSMMTPLSSAKRGLAPEDPARSPSQLAHSSLESQPWNPHNLLSFIKKTNHQQPKKPH